MSFVNHCKLVMGLLAFTATAFGSALPTYHISSDSSYLSLVGGSSEPYLVWVAEGRIGSAGDGNKANLGATTSAPAVTANIVWQNGVAVPWILSFDSTTNLAAFSIGGSNMSYTVNPASNLQLFIRTAAISYSAGTTLSSQVSNLNFIQGSQTGAVGDTSFANNPTNSGAVVDYLNIGGVNYDESFTLTGNTTFAWGSSTAPTGSRLAFEVKLTNVVAAPEPATLGMSGGGLLLAAILRLRQRRRE
jgi:hypothetical protein